MRERETVVVVPGLTDVAMASAGVTLSSADPRSVFSVHRPSVASYQKMTQNLWWAAEYNPMAVPLAAGVLAPIGFILPMSVGALLLSLSTLVLARNAQLLRRLDLRPEVSANEVLGHRSEKVTQEPHSTSG